MPKIPLHNMVPPAADAAVARPDPADFLALLGAAGAAEVVAIAAISSKRALGYQNGLPWDIPEDVAFFEHMVAGGALLVGRRTYHTMPVVPPDTFVVSSDASLVLAPGARRVQSVEQGLGEAGKLGKRVFIIGGADIYRAAWPHCRYLVLTQIEADCPGDTFLPDEISWAGLPVLRDEQHVFVNRRTGQPVTCRFACFRAG